MKGELFVVATPIGNLKDITLRALEVLKSVDIIACENASTHLKLLNYYGIKKRLYEYSPKNEEASAKGLIGELLSGKNIALVSDAGTPLLSDPGKKLLKLAFENGINVIPVPGASALSTILSVCFLPEKKVFFLGFLPKSEKRIEKILSEFLPFDGILVLFVSPYNIKKILSLINKLFGNVEIIIGREMTKKNEEIIYGRLENIINKGLVEKGEFTLAFLTKAKD